MMGYESHQIQRKPLQVYTENEDIHLNMCVRTIKKRISGVLNELYNC